MENLLASQHPGGMISALASGHYRAPPILDSIHPHPEQDSSSSSAFSAITISSTPHSTTPPTALSSLMQQMLTSTLAHRDLPLGPVLPTNSAVAMLAYLQLVHSVSGRDSNQSDWTEKDSLS